ncbi:MAG: MBL fold metallo-hydrolase, partial [bacterium]
MPSFNRGASAGIDRPGSLQGDDAAIEPLRIFVIDVGQGDATLIQAPSGEAMLVDAGPVGAGIGRVVPALASRKIAQLEYIVLTHFHDDHTGGLSEVLAGQDGLLGTADDITLKGEIYVRGTQEGSSYGDGAPLGAERAAPPERAALAGDRIGLGDCDVEVVAADGVLKDGIAIDLGDPPDENARSIALLISYKGFRMLIAADLTGGGNDPPYQTPDMETPLAPLIGDIDVLRVAHHGSHTSTNQAFLDATKPEVAIISVGDGNDFFHPHTSVIDQLIDAGVSVYQTERGYLDRDGPVVADGDVTIEVKADGG